MIVAITSFNKGCVDTLVILFDDLTVDSHGGDRITQLGYSRFNRAAYCASRLCFGLLKTQAQSPEPLFALLVSVKIQRTHRLLTGINILNRFEE